MASSYHLLVAIPEKDPISYSLSGDTVCVGRSPVNDIQILVREISTSHCEFTATESGYQIADKGSTNGTKVNDRAVKEPVELHTRDVILLGETVPSYFIVAEEGADIDLKAEIAEIEKARSMPKKPTVKNLTAPGAVKKVGLPTKKPLEAVPVAVATPADIGSAGAATVKLAQTPPRPSTKLGSPPPPAVKLAPPGAPSATPAGAPPAAKPPGAPPASPPAATKLPTAPPVKKLAPPGSADAAPASTPPSAAPPSPAVKLATPGAPPSPPVKLPSPGAPPAPPANAPAPGAPPAPAPAPAPAPGTPPAPAPGGIALNPSGPPPPSKKLSVPVKKVAPKLNIPDKEE